MGSIADSVIAPTRVSITRRSFARHLEMHTGCKLSCVPEDILREEVEGWLNEFYSSLLPQAVGKGGEWYTKQVEDLANRTLHSIESRLKNAPDGRHRPRNRN